MKLVLWLLKNAANFPGKDKNLPFFDRSRSAYFCNNRVKPDEYDFSHDGRRIFEHSAEHNQSVFFKFLGHEYHLLII